MPVAPIATTGRGRENSVSSEIGSHGTGATISPATGVSSQVSRRALTRRLRRVQILPAATRNAPEMGPFSVAVFGRRRRRFGSRKLWSDSVQGGVRLRRRSITGLRPIPSQRTAATAATAIGRPEVGGGRIRINLLSRDRSRVVRGAAAGKPQRRCVHGTTAAPSGSSAVPALARSAVYSQYGRPGDSFVRGGTLDAPSRRCARFPNRAPAKVSWLKLPGFGPGVSTSTRHERVVAASSRKLLTRAGSFARKS